MSKIEEPLSTSRLELHHISRQGIIELFEDKLDVAAIASRNFCNPHQVLINNSGPLAWRVPQVKEDESINKWFVRWIVLKESKEIIGSTSFHGAPDTDGMIEIGLGIEEKFQGNGYAKEALTAMWKWACGQADVRTLRYTVSPDNQASIAVINYFGFDFMGQQLDELDGPENIYEMSIPDFMASLGK